MADYDVDTDGGGTYNSMSAAEAALPATWTEDNSITCQGSSPDTNGSSLIFSGYTHNGYRLTLQAALGEEASTEWDTTIYRYEYTGNAGEGLDIQVENFTLQDLQISGSLDNRANESWVGSVVRYYSATTSGSTSYVRRNYIRVVGNMLANNTAGSHRGISLTPGEPGAPIPPILYVHNNIISWEVTGAYTWATTFGLGVEHREFDAYYENNTIVGDWIIGAYATGAGNVGKTAQAVNNLIDGSVVAIYGDLANSAYCSYNATDLASIGYAGGVGDRTSQTFSFESVTNYALTGSDTGALDYGSSTAIGGLFTDDINGTVRVGSWDIGAHEYVASGGSTYTVTCDNGSFAYTGNVLSPLKTSYVLCDSGSFAHSGADLGIYQTFTVGMLTESFAYTGNALAVTRQYIVPCDNGSYAYSGQDLNLFRNLLAILDNGFFTYVGYDLTLAQNGVVTLDSGSFVYNGYQMVPLTSGNIVCDSGSFNYTGYDLNVLQSVSIPLDSASFNYTGYDLAVLQAGTISLDSGSFITTGHDILVEKHSIVGLDTVSFNYAGYDVSIFMTYTLPLDNGSYVFSGHDLGVIKNSLITCESGSFTYTGNIMLIGDEQRLYYWDLDLTLEQGFLMSVDQNLTTSLNTGYVVN